MAYDPDVADRVREELAAETVVEKPMFGGLAFLLDGHMCVAANGQGGLLVRHDPAESERLLEQPGTAPMQMGDRAPMKGWVLVDADVLDDATLTQWVNRGVAFAKSLPPK